MMTDTIVTHDDDGNLYMIYEYTDSLEVVARLRTYLTGQGELVNRNKDGTFDILSRNPKTNQDMIRVHREGVQSYGTAPARSF